MEGKKYEDRACCESGGIVPSESCPPNKLRGGTIAGIVIGSVFVLCICSFFLNIKMRQVKARKKPQKQREASANSNELKAPEGNWGVSGEGMMR